MITSTFSIVCIVATTIVLASALTADPPAALLTADFADRINSIPGLSWTATHQNGHLVSRATRDEIKQLLGVRPRIEKILSPRNFTKAELEISVPASFDALTNWPHCPTIGHIRDQSACGSCWAVAAAESMSDRYCTYGIHNNLLISAANIMECCWYCGSGCNGGDPGAAWQDWVNTGLLSDECQPYPFPKCEHHMSGGHYPPCPTNSYPTPTCSSTCSGAGNMTLYHGSSAYSLSGVDSFQKELLAHGPFEVAFDVYEDFLAYKSGVYVRTSSQYLGGHAVKVVGWGTLKGVNYWKIANSWNSDWGMSGYFLIRRGTDECGIEDSGSAGVPAGGSSSSSSSSG